MSATPERRRGAGFGCDRGRRRGGVSPNECMRYSDAQVQRDVWLARLRIPPVVSLPCRAPAPGMRLGRWPRGAHRWPRTGRPPTRFATRKDAGQNVAPGHKLHRCSVRRERPPTTQLGSPRSAVKSRTARLDSRTTRCLASRSGSALDCSFASSRGRSSVGFTAAPAANQHSCESAAGDSSRPSPTRRGGCSWPGRCSLRAGRWAAVWWCDYAGREAGAGPSGPAPLRDVARGRVLSRSRRPGRRRSRPRGCRRDRR